MPLAEALAELDAANLTLEQARRRAEEAAAVARQAAAAYLPSVSASATLLRNSDEAVAPLGALAAVLLPPGAPRPPDLVIQPEQSVTGTLTVRVPIVAAEAWSQAAAARRGARASAHQADAARQQLRTALVQAAWAAQAAEGAADAWARAAASARELAASAERAVRAGTGIPLAAHRARAEALRRESERVRAAAELARARRTAGALLGRDAPIAIAAPPLPEPAGADPDDALARRPEVAAQDALVAAADRRRRAARARWIPQVAATASAFASDVPFPTGDRQGWRATVDLAWPIWDGGLREARIREADAAALAARAASGQQRLEVRREVDDAGRDVGVAAERLRLAEEQRAVAAEADASARRSEAAGVAGALEVLDASDRLAQSEVALAEARARLGAALAALDRAAGRS
jgi:outer membrane protein TolC